MQTGEGRSSRTTTAGLAPAIPPGREFWLCSPLALDEVQGEAEGLSSRMQMSKFSPSSHPCGMQDESCPNGAHSCYFGGLRRCIPGHPGRENHTQPRFLQPWQPVHRWRKGGQDPSGSLRAPSFHTGPGDAGGRKGGCQGSSWDGAESGMGDFS